MPSGVTVEALDWLPSGARSGLVRIRGRRVEGQPWSLPELVLEHPEGVQRLGSLPDPRAERDLAGWRGAYVVDVALAAVADGWALEWADGLRLELPRPDVAPPASMPPPEESPEERGGQVVDRAVMAERRARKAEAAEQAQARIAREALRAVEVLELRAGDVEDKLAQAERERDELIARLAETPEAAGDAAPGWAPEEELRAEVEWLRAELVARTETALPLTDAERRAVRLREALTETVATVADLRLQLHEAQVARRTREVQWSADAVRLTVLTREHEDLTAGLAAARDELAMARAEGEGLAMALEEAHAAVDGAEAAHAETRRHFMEGVERLQQANERVSEMEAEVARMHAEVERAEMAVAEAQAREQAAGLAADERVQAAEDAALLAQARLAHLEATIDEVETARELAEARALAAISDRRVAEVAHAAATEGLGGTAVRLPGADALAEVAARMRHDDAFARGGARFRRVPESSPGSASGSGPDPAPGPPAGLSAVPALGDPPAPAPEVAPRASPAPPPQGPESSHAPPPAPADLVAAAADQVRIAAERLAAGHGEERERMVADLAAAADALRRRTTIVSPPGDPPGDLVRGRSRELPPLRGALVKLAHDDATAAGELLAALLPAQHALLERPLDYDLTIQELGTYAVTSDRSGATVSRLSEPRGRRRAAFHLRADALTLAEMLAGSGPRPRRLSGRARVSGSARRARALDVLAGTTMSLEQAVRAGAAPDPVLAVRLLAYAVPPVWTRGHTFLVHLQIGEASVYVCVRDGAGLSVTAADPGGIPHARAGIGRDAFMALLAGEPGQARFEVDGDAAAVDRLRGWLDRVRG